MQEKKTKIVVAGGVKMELGKQVAEALPHMDVVDADDFQAAYLDGVILIGDERWVPGIKKTPYSSASHKLRMATHMLAGGFPEPYRRALGSGIDIVEEYKLIQLKKSHLSRWERDEVEYIFESTYTKVI